MLEFLKDYWYFVVAGAIFVAIAIYWVVEISRSKRASKKATMPEETESTQTEQSKPSEQKNTSNTTTAEPEQKPAETTEQEKPAETTEKEKPVEKPKTKSTKTSSTKTKNKPKEESPTKPNQNLDKPSYIVVYDAEKFDWVVKKEGSERATKRCHTKQEALTVIENLAKKSELKVTVAKKDGEVQKVTKAKKSQD